MRILFIIITLVVLITSCKKHENDAFLFSYFVENGKDGLHLAYSFDGLKWDVLNNGEPILSPMIGKDKLMRDPCIIKGPDNMFHMVWTTGWWDKYIGYASSSNLIDWTEQKIIPVMQHEPEAKNCWAPEIFYDKANKNYIIFWATTIPDRHSVVAESDREKGLNHRIYSTSTKDFKTFSPTRLFFNPSFSVIDATIMEKEDDFIMFVKNENPNPPEKNIRFTKAEKANGSYSLNVSEPITGNYWAEGPTPLLIDDYTYIYFDKYRNHQYGAVRSKDLQTWEDVSDSISFPSGIRHGTAFKVDMKFIETLKHSFIK